jgi:hypothetical protein
MSYKNRPRTPDESICHFTDRKQHFNHRDIVTTISDTFTAALWLLSETSRSIAKTIPPM